MIIIITDDDNINNYKYWVPKTKKENIKRMLKKVIDGWEYWEETKKKRFWQQSVRRKKSNEENSNQRSNSLIEKRGISGVAVWTLDRHA